MIRLIGQKIAFSLLVIITIILFVHMGMRMVHNSDTAEPSYDWIQFAQLAWSDTRAYLTNLAQGDLGGVRINGVMEPISKLLFESYRNSMGLLIIALAIATAVGLVAGSTMALTGRKRLITIIMALTLLGMSLPAFFGGLLLQRAEIWYVARGGKPLVAIAGFGWDMRHMLLPVIVLTARPLAQLTRTSFISLDRTLKEGFITTAYSKGLSTFHTVNGHALKNIAIPFMTAVGVSLRFSLSALPIVEFFFVWPGIGLLMLRAINQRQTTLVVTLAVALGVTFLVINFILDIAYYLIDPRLREESI
ncbi:MAG: ABC transporter permease [Candidatus Promineifilaceae bacterium]|nr:ABC transporter permease [Candidatus Promineifilaceae bacterium]